MKRLIVIAVESVEPLSIDHMALELPALAADVRAYGEIINDPKGPKQVGETARRCLDVLATEQNVSVWSGLTLVDLASLGMRAMTALFNGELADQREMADRRRDRMQKPT